MIKKIVLITCLSLSIVGLAGCVPAQPAPKLNPLQIQAMQTQDFNAPKKKTFDAVMTVLQNEGYMIQTADLDTGFITGKSTTKSDGWGDQSTLSVTAFITKAKKKNKIYSHVRLSFVENKNVIQGRNSSYTISHQIIDTSLYRQVFNAIRQQVFVAGAM